MLRSAYGINDFYNFSGADVIRVMNNSLRGIKKKTYLNILICGSSGIGKTSFIELFLKKFNSKAAEELLN